MMLGPSAGGPVPVPWKPGAGRTCSPPGAARLLFASQVPAGQECDVRSIMSRRLRSVKTCAVNVLYICKLRIARLVSLCPGSMIPANPHETAQKGRPSSNICSPQTVQCTVAGRVHHDQRPLETPRRPSVTKVLKFENTCCSLD